MRSRRHIERTLHVLAELICLVLLAGAIGAARAWAAALATALLCLTIASHLRYVRQNQIAAAPVHSDDPRAPRSAPAAVPAPQHAEASPATETPVPEAPQAKQPETPVLQVATDEVAADEDAIPCEEGPVHLAPSTQALRPTHEAPQASTLDFAALCDRLMAADDPIAELKAFVGDIRTRMADEPDDASPSPCGLERYAARTLEEAGLFASDVELPALSVVRPRLSRMVYLRTEDRRIPYLAKLRVIRLEAALNAVRFASSSLEPQATVEEAYAFNQRLVRSIAAQAAPLDEPLSLDGGGWPDGEWAVRYGISQAIESFQLPYRLQARWRTNVADGNVALEIDLTPADAFPASCQVEGMGIVPTTGDMRQQASADYALRLGLLVAAAAFRCSGRIRHVWVAGIIENATRRTCYYSVDFDRYRFARLDLGQLGDLAEVYRGFAAVLRLEQGWLRPVKQGFHLEEERFCPSRRYMPVSLSSRRLDGHVAASLGTDHVSGLAIEEADGRTLVANAIMMRLAPESDKGATLKNVRTVMDLAGDDPDPTVRMAAERVVNGLIDGTLAADPLSVGEEFVRGDALTRAVDRAKELLMGQRPQEAQSLLAPLVAHIDANGIYADSPAVTYRYFSSYVERALYNRLCDDGSPARATLLVPDAYYEAHLLLSITNLLTGAHQEALAHAERLVALAPLDPRARLHLVKCLEVLDRDDEAMAQLRTTLESAYEPQGLGLAYYRMAFFQWKRGAVTAAQACYQRAMEFLPAAVPMMAMELSVLYLQNPGALSTEVTEEQVDETLEAHDIPLAPTERTSEVFLECAQASLDAEIFPVARNFAHIMGTFSGDDVLTGLLRSLEDAPDR